MDSYRNWPEREWEVFIDYENNWMTPQKCIDICYQKGFAFAGLGFGLKLSTGAVFTEIILN